MTTPAKLVLAIGLALLASPAFAASNATIYAAPGNPSSPAGSKCPKTAPCSQSAALALAQNGKNIAPTIVLTSGTYTQGMFIGNVPGGLTIQGPATIAVSDCSQGNNALQAEAGAQVKIIGGLTLSTTCAGGSDLVASDMSQIILESGPVSLGSAPWAQMYVAKTGSIATAGAPITLSGIAAYGKIAAAHSTISISDPLTYNSPTYTQAVDDAIDGSLINIGSSISGSATGRIYSLAGASQLDIENLNPATLPGTIPGVTDSTSQVIWNH